MRRTDPTQEQAQEARVALLIGNADYSPLGRLKNPVNDVLAMRALLERLGFTVLVERNATLHSMKQALVKFGEQLRAQPSAGLFYYSGHGVQIDGQNYLVPVDARLENEALVEAEALSVEVVLDAMLEAKTTSNFVFLDACRDNPFNARFRSSQRGLAFMNAPTGTIIAYATSPGKVASDGPGNFGVYTSAILEHLGTPDVTIEQVLKRVGADVERATEGKQTPWYASSLRGEFSFASPTRSKLAAAAPRPTNSAQATNSVDIPAGSFLAGCDRTLDVTCGGLPDAPDIHTVELPEFRIGKTEVTVDEYRACVRAGRCSAGVKTVQPQRCDVPRQDADCNWGQPGRGNHPMNCVDWFQANSYCEWVGGRLPTNDEWEKAARGSDGRLYPWGDHFDGPMANVRDLAWLEAMPADLQQQPVSRRQQAHGFRDNYAATAPVGTFPLGASPQGAVDLVGNVSEWTWEAYARGGDYQNFAHWAGELGIDAPYISWGIYAAKPWWAGARADHLGFRCVWSKHPPSVAKPIDDRFERPSQVESQLRKQFLETHKASRFEVIYDGYRITQPGTSATGTVFVPGENSLTWLKGHLVAKQQELARCFAPLLSKDARRTDFTWYTQLELVTQKAAQSDTQSDTLKFKKGTSDCAKLPPSGPPNQRCDQTLQQAALECLVATASPIPGPLCEGKPLRLLFTLQTPPFGQ